MTVYVAFLRAVNVGGTGKLPMVELREMCTELGFESVKTYIASGNVVFTSKEPRAAVRSLLEERLHEYAGKDIGITIRTAPEIRRVLERNPFPEANPSYTLVTLLNCAPAEDALEQVVHHAGEEIQLGDQEIYVHYPEGMSRSKLRIPDTRDGTARNMNTIRKMVELAEALNAS